MRASVDTGLNGRTGESVIHGAVSINFDRSLVDTVSDNAMGELDVEIDYTHRGP